MNTIELTRRIEKVLIAFEQDSGSAILSVTPLLDLYRDYCDWSQRHTVAQQDIETFLLHITRRYGCMPCRLPDGSIGVLGIVPKAMMATGVMQ